jgi:hypothetical protein
MFESDLGNVFVGKKSEKPSEDKPSEQLQPKPKTKLIRFYYDCCGRDGHKSEFCLKRKCEERMAEWANKDRYRPSNGVPEPCMQMPKAKVIARTVSAWGDRKVVGGVAGRAPPVRPVRGTGQTGAGLGRQRFGSMLVRMLSLV